MITGYKIDTTDIIEIEGIVADMQKEVARRAKQAYAELLKYEIQSIVDNVALGTIQRSNEMTIFDIAKANLDARIAYASGRRAPTKYNLHVFIQVMFLDGCTYIQFNSNNNIYKKGLKKIENLEQFDFDPEKYDNIISVGRGETWKALIKKYQTDSPAFGMQLFPDGPIDVDVNKIKFDKPSKRAIIIARHNLTNQYLKFYASEQEIPNFKLMEYMDLALEQLTTQDAKEEMAHLVEQLNSILVNITHEMVTTLPNIQENTDGKEEEDKPCLVDLVNESAKNETTE